eukprot:6841934-Pyramimonas_sp.AAC.2
MVYSITPRDHTSATGQGHHIVLLSNSVWCTLHITPGDRMSPPREGRKTILKADQSDAGSA